MDAQIEELQAELNNQHEVGIDVGKTVNTKDKTTGDTVDNAVQDGKPTSGTRAMGFKPARLMRGMGQDSVNRMNSAVI